MGATLYPKSRLKKRALWLHNHFIMIAPVYFPVIGGGYQIGLLLNQRYRYRFGDQRLDKRYVLFAASLSENQISTIQKLGPDHNTYVGFLRFLHNPNVGLQELIFESTKVDKNLILGQNLLAIIDESIISLVGRYLTKAGLINHLGIGGNNSAPGAHCVPCLLLNADTHAVLGLIEVLMYKVPKASDDPTENVKNRKLRQTELKFTERSSSSWSEIKKNVSIKLVGAKSVTFIMDQGAYGAENILTTLEKGTDTGDILIRATVNRDRNVLDSYKNPKSLHSILESTPIYDTRDVPIKALNHIGSSSGKRKQRQAREAKIELKFGEFFMLPSKTCSPDCPQTAQKLYFVDVKEDPSTVPKDEDPIHWCLVTSRTINSIDEAWLMVKFYQFRWHIEQLFRILKNKGLDIEHTQLRNHEAIQKLIVMALKASVDALQLVSARDNLALPIETQFNEQEQEVLKVLNDKLEGRTEKQKNPYPEDSLAFGSWIIARLAGHSGYSYHKPPGPIIMKEGIEKFRTICWGIEAFNKKTDDFM